MIALNAESVREEVVGGPQYDTVDQAAIALTTDADIEAAICAAADDHFWAAYDSARGDAIRSLLAAAPEQTWTFFGHWDESDELVIEHAVVGEHQDVRPDDGHHPGGLWCDSATGPTMEAAEQSVREHYEG